MILKNAQNVEVKIQIKYAQSVRQFIIVQENAKRKLGNYTNHGVIKKIALLNKSKNIQSCE